MMFPNLLGLSFFRAFEMTAHCKIVVDVVSKLLFDVVLMVLNF